MLSTIAIALIAAFAATSYKHLPGCYTLRFSWISIKYLYLKSITIKKKSVSTPFTRHSYCAPLECDIFGLHKNNASYFTELDLARTETVLYALHRYFRGRIQRNEKYAFVPLASITNHFLKEIKPFQKYSIETKIVAWNDSSLLTISLFLIKAENTPSSKKFIYNNNKRVAAISIAKLVFKNGRQTVPPIEIITEAGVQTDTQTDTDTRARFESFTNALNDPHQLFTLYLNV